jgi:hypothetical protein
MEALLLGSVVLTRPMFGPPAGGESRAVGARIECAPHPLGGKGFPVKKLLLLLIVVALGAAVAYKVRGDA